MRGRRFDGAGKAPRVRTTLVLGGSAGERETAIAAALSARIPTAVILEGWPDAGAALPAPAGERPWRIVRIAPGCLCCSGNLVLRVTLNRILRDRPQQLYLGIATTTHLDQLRRWLTLPPYDAILELCGVLSAVAPEPGPAAAPDLATRPLAPGLAT